MYKASLGFKNQPGTIEPKVVRHIFNMIRSSLIHQVRKKIIIRGEEDLLAIPAILFAPIGTVVVYGQINRGVIVVIVTEEKKQHVQKLLLKFKIAAN